MTIIDGLLSGKVYAHKCESILTSYVVEMVMYFPPSADNTRTYPVEYITVEMRLTTDVAVRKQSVRVLLDRSEYESSIKALYTEQYFNQIGTILRDWAKDWAGRNSQVLITTCLDNLTEITLPSSSQGLLDY